MSLQEKPVCRLSARLRCGSLVGPLCSPLPRWVPDQSPPLEELTWNDFHIGLILNADWPGEGALPQGSPTNGDTAAWLIGRGQVAPLHFSFFSASNSSHCIVFFFFSPFYSFVLRLWERCGLNQWSTPSHSFVTPPPNALWITLRCCFSCLLVTCSVAIMDVVTRTLCLWG